MIAPIKTVMIKAVKLSTNTQYITNIFKPYATISKIAVDYIKAKRSENYKSVYITIDQWNDTEKAYEFMQLVRKGRARLNVWWEIQEYKDKDQQQQQQTNWTETNIQTEAQAQEDEWNDILTAIDNEYRYYCDNEHTDNEIRENENEWDELSTAINNECFNYNENILNDTYKKMYSLEEDNDQLAFEWSEFTQAIEQLRYIPYE